MDISYFNFSIADSLLLFFNFLSAVSIFAANLSCSVANFLLISTPAPNSTFNPFAFLIASCKLVFTLLSISSAISPS
jgi:hypothetical protein